MPQFPISQRLPDDEASAEARRAGRLRCSMVGSNQGEVLDVSSTGARVLLKKNPDLKAGDSFQLELETLSGPLSVDSTVVWVRLNADKRFEMGVEFSGMSEESRRKLLETVLHPTRAETLRRGWTLIEDDEQITDEDAA